MQFVVNRFECYAHCGTTGTDTTMNVSITKHFDPVPDSTAPPDPVQTRRNAGAPQEISIMPVPKLEGPESDNAQQSIQFVMEPSEDVCFSG